MVEVDGIEATDIIDISFGKETGDSIGTAELTVSNTDVARAQFRSGSDVVIYEQSPDGTFEASWSGEVIGTPSNVSRRNMTLEIEAETKTAQLEYAKINRPFIERTSSEMVELAVSETVAPTAQTVQVTDGSSLDGVSSNGDNFEFLDTGSDIVRFGDNAIYADVNRNHEGDLYVEFDVPVDAIPERRILKAKPRLVVNNGGGIFDVTLTAVDAGGIQYKWDIAADGAGEYLDADYPVEEADITTGATPGTVRLTLSNTKPIPESRAVAIDAIEFATFRTDTRDIGIEVVAEDTEFRSTKRIDKSILELVSELSEEEGYENYVSTDDTLRFEPVGIENAPVEIDENDPESGIVDIEVDRDFDVRNRVTIQGRGDLQASFEDAASIQFYNVNSPKEEAIDAPSLRTREQLRRRARGYLNENAWDDTAITIKAIGSKYRDVKRGQAIPITVPSEDVEGTFVVSSTGRTNEGYTTIGVSGNVVIQ